MRTRKRRKSAQCCSRCRRQQQQQCQVQQNDNKLTTCRVSYEHSKTGCQFDWRHHQSDDEQCHSQSDNMFHDAIIKTDDSCQENYLIAFDETTLRKQQKQRIVNGTHLPKVSFITLLYISTCFFSISQTITDQNDGIPNLFQSVAGQRTGNKYQQQPFPQLQHSLTTAINSRTNNLPDFIAQQGGIIKDRNITLSKQFNPIIITKDIVIKRDAKLTIESGTELLFDKRKGIIVYGILEILGSSNDRVKLNLLKSQKSATVNFRSQNNDHVTRQQVRLVDGDLPSEGRVQIKFSDRWHSLCTNSKNLTAADIKVICQQVGYQDGHWYRWFPRKNETTMIPQMMSKSFHCGGTETAITQCKRWNRVRTGGGVCDYHSDIGIRCSKTLSFISSPVGGAYEFWRGIEFISSETTHEYVLEGQMKQRVSRSNLRHLSISDSGTNEVGNATAAIRVFGQPPKMSDIEIKNSVYGIMIEDAEDAIRLNNIRLINNMGNPLFINTSWGKVFMENLHVENNGGDGIRVSRHEKIVVGAHDFCKFANLGSSQSFPVVLSHEQTFFTVGRDCCQEFISNNQLTLHFPVLRSTPNNLLPESDNDRRLSIPPGVNLGKDAHLVIYDDYRDEFPFRLRIQNSTRAQSIVSKSGRLKICYEPASYRTVLFTIEVVADEDDDWTGIARDVEIRNSFIKGNEGRGIWIENQRSGVKIINTTVLNHNYLSGMHFENGTGEVIIQRSEISNNTGHGVFINLAGGYYHIDNSTISGNTLKGISIEYDKRPELAPFNHTFHLGYSLITRNGENGLFIGNVCRSDAFWNISMNSFIRNEEDAILFQSCLPTPDAAMNFKNLTSRLNLTDPDGIFHNNFQEVFITHNVFLANARRAVSMAPVFFVKSFIRHNIFRDHPLAVLYISNHAVPDFGADHSMHAPVNIRVASNRFYSNGGRYVANIGVQDDNPKHSLVFTKNTLEGNFVSEPYIDLKPRSRVSAVVVVSSSNTKVIRNRFDNPQSVFEMGSHLEMHSKVINATTNFWGPNLDATAIYRRIFDRKNRYNLAQIEFLQYLLSPEDLEYATDLSFDRERDKISTFKNGTRLGGEVKGYEELRVDTYIVQDDIYVRPGAHLILKPGTVLKFHDGVGLMVQGRLDAIGQSSSQIMFTSVIPTNRLPQRVPITTTPGPLANPWISSQPSGTDLDEGKESIVGGRRSAIIKRETPNQSTQPIRLSHTTMGRLEVQIDGIWGPVCDYNFDINDAAVVCQQLGMILNKDDWLLEKFQYAANDHQQISMMSNNVLMTNLRCDPSLDVDITKCKAEISSRGDFDGMCNSEVGIRCFPPSWSGVRLGMGAEISTLEHVTIQRAGMFDYAAFSLKPALQVDFNRHWISSIVVKSNSDSGLGIMWNDVIGRHFSELSISDSKFLNNERHGIELRSRGLSIKSCSIGNNRQNGLDYSPTFSQRELSDLLSWLQTTKNSENVVNLKFPLQSNYLSVPSSEESYKIFIFQSNPQPDLKETFTIGTDPGHMLSIHLLNPIHPESTENLNMSIGTNSESPIWDFRVNMTSFPMISPGYKFHFNYSAGRKARGNIVLYIRSRYNNRDLKLLTKYIPPHLVMHKFEQTATNINSKLLNSLVITNSNITKNGIGLRFSHPNYPHGPQATYNRRYANESTNITNNIFDNNYFSSIFVGGDEFETNFDSLPLSKITPSSEINYFVLGNTIRRNKDGIRQFSRDIRYAHNVFHWVINDTILEYNRGGGINIVLPYYWRYDANLSHTVEIHNNSFLRNNKFEFSVDGHFVALNLSGNSFRLNICKTSLIAINGMEKKMLIKHNTIEFNTCSRILDFHIQSHADKMGSITAQFEYNSLRWNRKSLSNNTYASLLSSFKHPKLLPRLHPQASDYAFSLQGIQSLNITRNLFLNPELRYELVVGIIMSSDERTVNAVENYWGSVLQSEISDRIFDFDDWNNYAVAELSPFLTQDTFSSATMIGESRNPNPLASNKPLGGRLMKSLTLVNRREPYIIESDFTIMPNVRLTIEKGVILEFMPNVGILVLGDLVAAGTRDRPIQMRPVLSAADLMPLYQYLSPPRVRPNLIQTYLNDPSSSEYNYSFKHYQFAFPVDMGSLRLCKNEICNDGSHIYENNVEDHTLRQEVLRSSNNTWKMDGFLELFNMTTLQWVPVCDPLFTEHTARVVCKQLGYTHLSIFRRGRRYTIEQEQITSIRHWPESVQCEGSESNLSFCPLAPLGYTNHSTACSREGNQFVYVYCQDFPEPSSGPSSHALSNEHIHHWGGIRFSCPSETNNIAQDERDSYNTINQSINSARSKLQYVTIDRAGMLHSKKSPAVQVLQCNVQIEFVAITNSAHHGLEMIGSHGNQNFHQLRIRDSLGIGFNYLSLTGSSSASRLVPYLPLKHLEISSDIFGLVDICGASKEIQIEERLLLFYRYTSQPVDCVKIISSKLNIKHIGMRMLQFNLYNSTSYTQRPDSIRIYDGNIFDRDSRLLVEMGVTERHRIEKPELKFYQTTDSSMTIRLHVSGSSPLYGFIAEVVSTPVSYNIQRDTFNNMTFSEITNNKLGALTIASAGESSPNMIIKNNRFEANCMHLFGNFTSCVSSVYMELQNCQRLRIINNLIKSNQGGIMIKSYSHSAVSALDASIDNNVFEENQNSYTLALLGPKTDPYQTVRVSKNFFTRNIAQYMSNLVLSRIVANFSHNIMSGNLGKHQIEVIGFDKLPLSSQTFVSNWVYNNTATLERDRSTIFGNSAGQQYFMNYLVNPDNHFEISTMNWSRYDVRPFHTPRDDEIIHMASGDGSSKDVFRKTADAIPISIVDTKKIDLYLATIHAKQNWWGFNTTSAIQGRIRDRLQHEELLKVDFIPFLDTNHTILSGICAGGWQRVGEACLVYVGTRMTYHEAKDFCDRERATLPLLGGNHYEFSDFIKSQERDFEPRIDRIWVRSFEVSRDACPALNDHRTKNYDCYDKYAFLCEKDPQIVVSFLHWHRETGGLVALILALITTILTACCTICWAYKSRQRHKEKIERKNSIYASMRSNRGPYSSSNSLSELFLHRQIYNPEKSSITDLSLSTQMSQPSFDSPNQIRLDPSYGTAKNNRIRSNLPMNDQALSHVNSRSNLMYDSQLASNPAYTSPLPKQQPQIRQQLHLQPQQSKQQLNRTHTKTPTPTPSDRSEIQPSRRSISNGSRTPSYAGSQTGANEVFTNPMPTFTAPAYSQIDHGATFRVTNGNNFNYIQPSYQTFHEPAIATDVREQRDIQAPLSNGSNQMGDIEESESSVPTYYSNQVETYEESTQSYLEAYNDAYANALQKMSDDNGSYVITERSSMTDLLINTMKVTKTSIIGSSQSNLVKLDPRGVSAEFVDAGNEILGRQNNKAHSETASTSQYNITNSSNKDSNRYFLETSFEFDETPKPVATSMFGSSQRLSPVSSSFAAPDSKLGSRVYLETSFE